MQDLLQYYSIDFEHNIETCPYIVNVTYIAIYIYLNRKH